MSDVVVAVTGVYRYRESEGMDREERGGGEGRGG